MTFNLYLLQVSNNKGCTFGSHTVGITSEGGNWTALCLGVVWFWFGFLFFYQVFLYRQFEYAVVSLVPKWCFFNMPG